MSPGEQLLSVQIWKPGTTCLQSKPCPWNSTAPALFPSMQYYMKVRGGLLCAPGHMEGTLQGAWADMTTIALATTCHPSAAWETTRCGQYEGRYRLRKQMCLNSKPNMTDLGGPMRGLSWDVLGHLTGLLGWHSPTDLLPVTAGLLGNNCHIGVRNIWIQNALWTTTLRWAWTINSMCKTNKEIAT